MPHLWWKLTVKIFQSEELQFITCSFSIIFILILWKIIICIPAYLCFFSSRLCGCRNPDGDVQPWCYIADHEEVSYWKYCDIPSCQSKKLPLLSLLSALRDVQWACRLAVFITALIFPPAMHSFVVCSGCTELLSSKKCL